MIVNRFIYACLYRGTASYLEKVHPNDIKITFKCLNYSKIHVIRGAGGMCLPDIWSVKKERKILKMRG